MVRKIGLAATILGATIFAWAMLTMIWQEPVTAIQHHQAQAALKAEARQLHTSDKPAWSVLPKVPEGHAVGYLHAKAIGTVLVVSGANPGDLVKGPGLWHVWPGRGGTTVISGHRTTYGAPFRHIDRFQRGSLISLRTSRGVFRYRVTHKAIVKPTDISVVNNVGYEQLVLTACHPVYSAAQRYIVFARRIAIS